MQVFLLRKIKLFSHRMNMHKVYMNFNLTKQYITNNEQHTYSSILSTIDNNWRFARGFAGINVDFFGFKNYFPYHGRFFFHLKDTLRPGGINANFVGLKIIFRFMGDFFFTLKIPHVHS